MTLEPIGRGAVAARRIDAVSRSQEVGENLRLERTLGTGSRRTAPEWNDRAVELILLPLVRHVLELLRVLHSGEIADMFRPRPLKVRRLLARNHQLDILEDQPSHQLAAAGHRGGPMRRQDHVWHASQRMVFR